MELPKWAFKSESAVRGDGSIDMIFRLRPLGRVWLFFCAIVDLIRTATVTITIEFQEGRRPRVTHDGEVIEPKFAAEPSLDECLQFVRAIRCTDKLSTLADLAREQRMFILTPQDVPRREA
jgi:hypothetical protein